MNHGKASLIAPLLIVMIFLSVPSHVMAQYNPGPPKPGFLSFWNMRFQINFPNNWNIMKNLPDNIRFNAPGTGEEWAHVIVNWGYPAPSCILDKSAWVSNMTKQGIIVDRIDNTTTVANNTGLVISFIDNDVKYSVALTERHNQVFDLVYFAPVYYFQTYEDEANTMLSTLQINGWCPTFVDSGCKNSLLVPFGWWNAVSGQSTHTDCPLLEEQRAVAQK